MIGSSCRIFSTRGALDCQLELQFHFYSHCLHKKIFSIDSYLYIGLKTVKNAVSDLPNYELKVMNSEKKMA